jgi:hypothetical protein
MNQPHPTVARAAAAAAAAGWVVVACAFVVAAAVLPAGRADAAARSAPLVVPTDVKSKPVLTAADRATVDQFLAGQLATLTNLKAKPAAQQAARDKLVAQVSGTGGSPAYLDAYAQSLSRQLLPLLKDKNVTLRMRLNLAIVAERIASKSGNAAMMDAAVALMDDKAEPVAMWGAKAAGHIVPRLIKQGGASKQGQRLAAAILGAVRKFPASGPVVEEAYDALSLSGQELQDPEMPDNVLLGLVQPLIDLLGFRVQQFAAGLPPTPAADTEATTFLTYQRVWNQLSAKQKGQVVSLLCNYLSLAAQHAANMDPADRAPLIGAFQRGGSALVVIGTALQGKEGEIATTGAAVRKVTAQTSADGLTTRVEAACKALVTSGKFPDLKPAPTLEVPVDDASETDPAEGDASEGEPASSEEPAEEPAEDSPAPAKAGKTGGGAGNRAGANGKR